MNITDQQLANAAKALGVIEIFAYQQGDESGEYNFTGIDINCHTRSCDMDKDQHKNVGVHAFGPGFAEWAVPVLEENYGLDLFICACGFKLWRIYDRDSDTLNATGPDIDTAVFLLAAKIGEGME